MPPPSTSIAHDRPTRSIIPIERLTYDTNKEQTTVSLNSHFQDPTQQEIEYPSTYMVSKQKDTMYLHQSKVQPDWNQFHEVMVKEVQ